MGSRSVLNRTNSAPQILSTAPKGAHRTSCTTNTRRSSRVLRKQRSVDAAGATWTRLSLHKDHHLAKRPSNLPRLRIFAPESQVGKEVAPEDEDASGTQSAKWCGDRTNVALSTETTLKVHNPSQPIPGYGRHFPQNKEVLAKPLRRSKVAWQEEIEETAPAKKEDKKKAEDRPTRPRQCDQDNPEDLGIVVQPVTRKKEDFLLLKPGRQLPPNRVNLDIFLDTLDVPSEDDRSSSFSGCSPVNSPVVPSVGPQQVTTKPKPKRRDRPVKSAPVRGKDRRRGPKEDKTTVAEEQSSSEEEEETAPQKISKSKVLHFESAPEVVTMVSLVSPSASDNEWDNSCKLDHPIQEGAPLDKSRLLPPRIRDKTIGSSRGVLSKKEPVKSKESSDNSSPAGNSKAADIIKMATSFPAHKSTSPAEQGSDENKAMTSRGSGAVSRAKELWKEAKMKRTKSAPVPKDGPSQSSQSPVTSKVKKESDAKDDGPADIEASKSSHSTRGVQDNSPEEDEDGQPIFRNEKERECWEAYQKICRKGIVLNYETFLRGMLTPTEYRQLQKNPLVVERPKLKGLADSSSLVPA